MLGCAKICPPPARRFMDSSCRPCTKQSKKREPNRKSLRCGRKWDFVQVNGAQTARALKHSISSGEAKRESKTRMLQVDFATFSSSFLARLIPFVSFERAGRLSRETAAPSHSARFICRLFSFLERERERVSPRAPAVRQFRSRFSSSVAHGSMSDPSEDP